MVTFQVDDMTCGHCASTITRALKAADKEASVLIDMSAHRVQVEPVSADARALADAIKEAGYTPVPVQPGTPSSSKSSGACCGGCM